MANNLLTPDMITKEALMILHQKLNFVGNIHRGHDASFGNDGAKIGDSLRIRLPNKYTVTESATFTGQDTINDQVKLTITNQAHVGVSFTSKELTLDVDRFAELILEPAMSVLAANVENNALSMMDDVYNQVGDANETAAYEDVVDAGVKLNKNLAPLGQRCFLWHPTMAGDFRKDTKGLFNDQATVGAQYREGIIGRTGGFDHYENTLIGSHTNGGATTRVVNGDITDEGGETADSTTGLAKVSTLAYDGGSGEFAAGDVITIAGCFRVHPETKETTADLQQFTVVTAGTGTCTIAPALFASGPHKNVSTVSVDNAAISYGTNQGVSETFEESLAFHKNAFAFATADLVMPKGLHFASRQVYDGLSLRLLSDYDIDDDLIKTRIDILYGYKTIRPELATRVVGVGA